MTLTPGSQIAFQINTVLVSVFKPHYPALVNVTKHAHRRVISKNNVPVSDAICESEHGSGTERRRRGVSIPCSASGSAKGAPAVRKLLLK